MTQFVGGEAFRIDLQPQYVFSPHFELRAKKGLPPLREINSASVLTFFVVLSESPCDRACLAAGVIYILRSLFPLPMTDSISEFT